MLPGIAAFFDVTVDELLGVGKDRIDQAIMAYKAESAEYKNAGENDRNLALWEKAYREFPNDCRVMEELMFAVNREAVWPCPPEMAERILFLGKRILQESTDTKQRENAVEKLCYTYKSMGDEENAVRYAEEGGNIYAAREGLLAFVQDGEDGVRACQSYLAALIGAAAGTAVLMAQKGSLTTEEEIAAYEFGIRVLKMLFSDDNVGFYAGDLSRCYACLARKYAVASDAEKALEALENSVKYAVMDAEGKRSAYTAFLVNRLTYEPAEVTKNYRGNACNLRLEELKGKEYDFLRDRERFQAAERRLERKKAPVQAPGVANGDDGI